MRKLVLFLNWNLHSDFVSSEQRIQMYEYIRRKKPDFIFLQECFKTEIIENFENDYHIVTHEFPPAEHRDFSTATLSKDIEMTSCFPIGYPMPRYEGSTGFICSEYKLNNVNVTLINIYAVNKKTSKLINSTTYATTTMHRILSDIQPILDNKLDRRIIIGGDFNVSRQWEFNHNDASHALELDRLLNFELINCSDPNNQGDFQLTTLNWQNDYFFVSRNLSDQFFIPEVDNLIHLSDHYPIMMTVEL